MAQTQGIVRLHGAYSDSFYSRYGILLAPRFAWRTRVSMFHALRFCLRPRGFQRCMLFPTYARVRNPRYLHRDATRRWHSVDVVANRAGFVDNEPSFINGSPVTKPGRLRPCLVLFLMLPTLLPPWPTLPRAIQWTIHYIRYFFNLIFTYSGFCRHKYFLPAYFKNFSIDIYIKVSR